MHSLQENHNLVYIYIFFYFVNNCIKRKQNSIKPKFLFTKKFALGYL
jgi:hypothetical protein